MAEKARPEALGVLSGEVLFLGLVPFKEMFGALRPKLKRVGTRQYVEIDLQEPIAFARMLAELRVEAREQAAVEAEGKEKPKPGPVVASGMQPLLPYSGGEALPPEEVGVEEQEEEE